MGNEWQEDSLQAGVGDFPDRRHRGCQGFAQGRGVAGTVCCKRPPNNLALNAVMGAHACAELVMKLLFDELAVRHDGGRLPHRLLEERRAESIPALMETDQLSIVICAQLRARILLPTGCA